MFHKIPEKILQRMEFLEEIDSKDRVDGTERMQRLRQIPPETGKFRALQLINAPDGEIVEIGTSAGYSSLWLILASIERGSVLKTMELLPEKIDMAKNTFEKTGTTEYVDLMEGDALALIEQLDTIAFCFLDTEKELYHKLYPTIMDKMVKGGLLLADNVINHAETLKEFLDTALNDERLDALVVPIGNGVLLGRKI